METLIEKLHEQMNLGLQGKENGLMMLPSYVDVMPNGNEEGEYYAVDLGGTNLRVLWVRLGAERGAVADTDVQDWPIPKECYDTDNGRLLNWVADKVLEVMGRHSNVSGSQSSQVPVLGFCFSFACQQTALDNGKLLLWTKNFRGRGLIGQDVVSALSTVFQSRGIRIKIPALMNDTVATLIALRYSEPSTCMGIILGTGTNCAYIEAVGNITKLPETYKSRGSSMIINTEWGDLGAADVLPRCEEDLWVDFSSANPGHGMFEKVISGLYMGEVVRRIILRFVDRADLMGGMGSINILDCPLRREGGFNSAMVAAIDEDETRNLSVTKSIMKSMGFAKINTMEAALIRQICSLVANRSARLCAAAIVAVVQKCPHVSSSEEKVVAVDGSLFVKYKMYQERVRLALSDLLGDQAASKIRLQVVDGGSAAGAAYLAAATVHAL